MKTDKVECGKDERKQEIILCRLIRVIKKTEYIQCFLVFEMNSV